MKRRYFLAGLTAVLSFFALTLAAQAAILDRITLLSPGSGGNRGIDSVFVVEAAVRTTAPDSGLTVFFWLTESDADSLVLADTTSFGASNIADSAKVAIGASAGFFATRAPVSFIAARSGITPALNPIIGDGDSIRVVSKAATGGGLDTLIFTWYGKIPASTATFDNVRVTASAYDPIISPAFSVPKSTDEVFRVVGDRPLSGNMAITAIGVLGGVQVSDFPVAPTSRILAGIGDTIQVSFNLGNVGDGVVLNQTLSLSLDIFDRTIPLPRPLTAVETYNLVLSEDLFGGLRVPATTNSDTVNLFAVDAAGNLSSVSANDVVPSSASQSITFVTDTQRPSLADGVVAGDTLLPAAGDSITDGTQTQYSSGLFDRDEKPIAFTLAEGLSQLAVVFSNSSSQLVLEAENTSPFSLSLGPLRGGVPQRLDFTQFGQAGNAGADTFFVIDEGTFAAWGFTASSGDSLLETGLYDISFQGTDLAGNIGPVASRENVYIDTDPIVLSQVSPTNAAGLTTLNAELAKVFFQLSEPADSVEITYRGLTGSDAGIKHTRLLVGSELVDTENVQSFTVDGIQQGSQYELSVLARDLTGHFTRTSIDTFAYDTSFTIKPVSHFSIKSSAAAPVSAGTKITLTLSAVTEDTLPAVDYRRAAVLDVAKSPGSRTDLDRLNVTGAGATYLGGGRIALNAEGWVGGKRIVCLNDSAAADTLSISLSDSSNSDSIIVGRLDSTLVIAPLPYSMLVLVAPDTVDQGADFWVEVLLADAFGNTRTTDSRLLEIGADKLGIQLPAGKLFVQGGAGGFWANSGAFAGEGLHFVANNSFESGAVLSSTGPDNIVGSSNSVFVRPAGQVPVDGPDNLLAQDYMGADGQGDQGGFLLLNFDLSTDHQTLSAYRIWREIEITADVFEEGAALTTLDEPATKFIPWGRIDPVPGIEGAMHVVVATLDNVGTNWAVSAERGHATSAKIGGSSAAGQSAYEAMAATMVKSRRAAVSAGTPLFAALTPEALAFIKGLPLPQAKAGGDLVQSAKTYTAQPVAAADNRAPEPVEGLRALDTPADAGGQITLDWVASPSDRLLPRLAAGAVGPMLSDQVQGVWGYAIYRSTDTDFALLERVGPGQTTYVDPTAVNGVRYRYWVQPYDGENQAPASAVVGATAFRNRVLDDRGRPLLGLLGAGARVDFDDYFILADYAGLKRGDIGYEPAADLNGDGGIDRADLAVLAGYFGRSAAGQSATSLPVAAAQVALAAPSLVDGSGSFALEVRLEAEEVPGVFGLALNYDPAHLLLVEVGAGLEALEPVPGEMILTGAGSGPFALEFRPLGQLETSAIAVEEAALRGSDGQVLEMAGASLEIGTLPQSFALKGNFPNPFNPQTAIAYQLPESARVRLEVYNATGQLVRTLVDQSQEAGRYSAQWDGVDQAGRAQASGLYFYRLKAGGFSATGKMTLLK